MTKTVTDPIPRDIHLTLEDVAFLADGTGNLPDATAMRLKALVCCTDLEHVQETWRGLALRLERLRQMAADAKVDLLADGLYVYRSLERLRSDLWLSPTDVLDPRLDVPYSELISLALACADRAEGEEEAELLHLVERLTLALDGQGPTVPAERERRQDD